LSATHALFAEFKLWMLVSDVRPRTSMTIAWWFGATVTTRSTTVVCPYGLNKTIDVLFVSKSGLFKE